MRRHRGLAQQLAPLNIKPPHLRLGDLWRQAVLAVVRHPGRSLLTVVGTILGSAAFVSTLGLGSTMSQQVSASFDARRATEVLVEPEDPALDASWLTRRAEERLSRLNGVVEAGYRVSLGERSLSRLAGSGQARIGAPVIGADADALRVMAPVLSQGRLFDRYHDDQRAPVVLLSAPVAQQLGVQRTGVAVFMDARPYTVMGIYRDVARRAEAMTAVIIPYPVAEELASTGSDGAEQPKRDILIATAPGAAQIVSRQAPLAVRPESPGDLRALAPPDPRTLRREVEASVTRSTVLLSSVALLIGTISIGNAATAGIAARTGEIGLRRAVGARRRHIFFQLVAETAMLGSFGGVVGALGGLFVVSTVALMNEWVPVIEIHTAALACVVSAATGLLAGLIPASRAVRISPVQALQR